MSGLAVATAPNVAHFLPLFNPLLSSGKIGPGVATTLAAAVAATFFLVIGIGAVHRESSES